MTSSIRNCLLVAVLLTAGIMGGDVGVARAQATGPVRIDDGYTWFAVADNPRFGSTPRNEGWHPVASLRALGAFASGDALKMVVRQGSRTLARAQCQPTNLYGGTMSCGRDGSEWTGGEPMITATGDFLVDILHVNGQTDAETLLRTYKLKVEQVTRVNEGNFTPMPPLFVLNADARTTDAVLISEGGRESTGRLALRAVVSTTDTASALGSIRNSLRCSVDGQPITIANDQVGGRQGEYSSADGSSRPRSGNVRVEQPRDWRQITWALPIEFGVDAGGQEASLAEHPGTWICEIRANGQTLRAFRFSVRDGAVQAHPEEAQGLSLDTTEHLAEYWIPNAAVSHDAPLVAAALRAGGFYGHAWASPVSRDNAANPTRAPAFAAAGAAVAAAGGAPAGAGAAAGPAPVRYDDGFAWFELGNNVEPVNGSPTNLGWKLQANVRAYGTAAQRSAFRLVLKQGNRTIGEARCDAHEDGLNFVDYVEATDCGQRDSDGVGGPMRISATGAIQVEVHFVDGVTSVDSLLRTHTIQVLAATGIRGNGEPDATNYYISHNAEVLATLIEASEHSSLLPGGASRSGRVGISFQLSPTEAGITTLRDYGNQLRCRVNDQPIVLPRTQQTADRTMSTAVEHTRPDPASSANPIRDMVRYQRYGLELPINVGEESDTLGIAMRSKPGNWACDWRANGRTLRTFKWTVGADGAIVAHAEEASGLSLAPNAHLIETVIPADSTVDQRVEPAAARAGAFYGRAWTSPAMRASAAAVPTIGTPAPPQPSGRAAAGGAARGRRGRGR